MPVSQDSYDERLRQAVIQKATRILMLPGAPLGSWGDLTEYGLATVRPDHEVKELLAGMMFGPLPALETLVTPEDVIRQGLQTSPADFPAERLPDVQRAIASACSWVEDYIVGGVALA